MLINIKLKNSEDIVGYISEETPEWVDVLDPVSFDLDPHNGVYVKSWTLFSVLDIVRIDKKDISFMSQANDEAEMYYNQYMDKLNSRNNPPTNESYDNDLETIFSAMLESRKSIKH